MRIGIVADDLTGAMDSAAPFADLGMRTRVLLGGGAACTRGPGEDASVVAVDTHTRDVAAGDAAAAVRASAAMLRDTGMLPFKKIDSTLRGNLAVEIAAAVEGSGRTCALVTPAAPVHGRVLQGGRLFVDGSMAGDRSLPEMLSGGVAGWQVRCVSASAIGDLHALEHRTFHVVDAQSAADLDRIAAFGLAHADRVLLAGSSGLASSVAHEVRAGAARLAAGTQPRYERLWFVVGSYNARSAQQVRALLAARQVPTLVVPLEGELPVIQPEHRAASVGLVHVQGLGGSPARAAADVAARVAQVARSLVEDAGERETALFMTGGDTARAVFECSHAAAIELRRSLYAGVIQGDALLCGRRVGVVTKAGGFGSPDLFVRAAAELALQAL